MKTTLFAILASWILGSCSTASTDSGMIAGHIENNSEYRGGANPPESLIQELLIYKPSGNQVFYIRDAVNYQPFSPIIDTFTTDALGNYQLALAPGMYAVIGQEKYDFEQNPIATTDCSYLAEPDFVLQVTSGQNDYTSQYTLKRNHCLAAYPN